MMKRKMEDTEKEIISIKMGAMNIINRVRSHKKITTLGKIIPQNHMIFCL